jgi:ribosomal protein L14
MFRRYSLGLLTMLVAISCICVQAQSVTGTFTGTIYDPTGSAVIGAKVEVTNANTNSAVAVISSKDGIYTVTNLQPGTYVITVVAGGFESEKIQKVVLPVNAVVREDAHLKLGSSTETVNVDSGAPVISTEEASVGTVIDEHAVNRLLFNGRSVDQLLTTVAGNTSDGALSSTPNFSGSLRWGGTYFTIDGGNFNDLGNGTFAYSYATNLTTMPSTDTIQELKVQTSMANAEYEGGAAVVVVTKSGTNQFHGSLVEFNRNRALAAFDRFAEADLQP